MGSSSTGLKLLLVLLVSWVGLAGCGDDPNATLAADTTASTSTTTTAPTTAAPTTAAPTTATPTTAPTSTTPPTAPPPSPPPLAAPRAGSEFYFNAEYGGDYAAFQSPSGNIGCDIRDGIAACVVGENSWNAPPPDEYCDATWGISVEVAGSLGTLTCRGDATAQGPALPYGYEIEFGPVLCRSEESGVTCDNRTTGHGFKVNRASFDLY